MISRDGYESSLIVICGPQGSGKSTLAEALVKEYMGAHKIGAAGVVKLADPLYDLQRVVYDYLRLYQGFSPLEKGAKDRRLLQVLGTEWGKEVFGPDVWIKCWERQLQQLQLGLIVTDDCRFPEELAAAKRAGALTVRLKCDAEKRAERIGSNFGGTSHRSETAMDAIPDSDFDLCFDSGRMDVPAIVAQIVAREGVFYGAEKQNKAI